MGAIGTAACLTDVDGADDLPALRLALRAVADPLPVQQRLLEWLDAVVSSTPSMAGEA